MILIRAYHEYRLVKEFFPETAHMIIIGRSGSGKTQTMYFMAEGLTKYRPQETIVYFDTGKASEILTLGQFKPLNIMVPRGFKIDIKGDIDYIITELDSGHDVWLNLVRDRINVVCIEPFIRDPEAFVPVIVDIFNALIDLAQDNKIRATPLCIMYDEFHIVAPAKGHAINAEQFKLGGKVQFNVERVRSQKIRFIVSVQGLNLLRNGVRIHFKWKWGKQAAFFTDGKMKRYNYLFEKMPEHEAILIPPDMQYSNSILMPFYGDGAEYGTVTYHGRINKDNNPFRPKKNKKNKDKIIDMPGIITPGINTLLKNAIEANSN